MIDGLRAGHQLLLTAAGNRFFTLSTVVSDTCSRRMFPHDEGKIGVFLDEFIEDLFNKFTGTGYGGRGVDLTRSDQ